MAEQGVREGKMRALHTYKKENRFFYIWRKLQDKSEKKFGWWKFCKWAIRCPSHSIHFMRLLVAQRARIKELEYRLHTCEYARDYYMSFSSGDKKERK